MKSLFSSVTMIQITAEELVVHEIYFHPQLKHFELRTLLLTKQLPGYHPHLIQNDCHYQ